MAYGLQLMNSAGQIVLDTNKRTMQIAGVLAVNGSTPGATSGFGTAGVYEYGGGFVAFTPPNRPANNGIWFAVTSPNNVSYDTGTGNVRIYEGPTNTINYWIYNPSGSTSYIYYGFR